MVVKPLYTPYNIDDERIRQTIIEFRPHLVVIDTIQTYLGSDSDLQIAGRARKLMHRLGMWAWVYDCAIVLTDGEIRFSITAKQDFRGWNVRLHQNHPQSQESIMLEK